MNAAIAHRLAHLYACVSAAPHGDPAAQAIVLDAVRQDMLNGAAHPITPNLVQAAGKVPFTPQEVLHQLQQAKWSTSPWWDRLPVSMWRSIKRWVKLLARLYNACFNCNRLPAGFLDGTVTLLLLGAPGAPARHTPELRLTHLGSVLGSQVRPGP